MKKVVFSLIVFCILFAGYVHAESRVDQKKERTEISMEDHFKRFRITDLTGVKENLKKKRN